MINSEPSIEIIDRNYKIIKRRMIAQMEDAIRRGKNLINKELNMGIFSFITKPFINAFYRYWSNKELKEGTLKQIEITLNSAKLLILNGNTPEYFNKIIEESFPIYLSGDQTDLQCKKNHKNYSKLREINKKAYITQVQGAVEMLKITGNVQCYDDFVRFAFKDRETAYKSLSEQLEFTNQCIKIVEGDSSILTVPTSKGLILKVLRKGFEQTKLNLNRDLDETFK